MNTVGTVNVLEAARTQAPECRVLVASTGEVYGRAHRVPTPEDEPLEPRSPYAASKAAAEIACDQARRAGLDVVVARAFQHEGPGRDERFAVGSWAAQIARAEEAGGGTVRVGDLSAKRDIIDVRDVCRAYELMLEPSVPAGTYNVAGGSDGRDARGARAPARPRGRTDRGRARPGSQRGPPTCPLSAATPRGSGTRPAGSL